MGGYLAKYRKEGPAEWEDTLRNIVRRDPRSGRIPCDIPYRRKDFKWLEKTEARDKNRSAARRCGGQGSVDAEEDAEEICCRR